MIPSVDTNTGCILYTLRMYLALNMIKTIYSNLHGKMICCYSAQHWHCKCSEFPSVQLELSIDVFTHRYEESYDRK